MTRVWVRPTSDDHRVTTIELFFDLVFVFAFTQVTSFMATDFDLKNAWRGLIMLAVLWFPWTAYSWLGNHARADEGMMRVVLLLSMAAMFVAALAIPQAWEHEVHGLNASLIIAICIAFVRIGHLIVYRIAAGDDRELQRTLLKASIPGVTACALLIVGGVLRDGGQSACWIAALIIDYTGIFAASSSGWRVISAAHFAERYGLIVMIAIGESIVSVGVGVQNEPITWPVIVAALSALTIAACLWWTYFDVVALVAECVLQSKTGGDRTRMGRDSYTYLHFPMVVGIIFLSLGFKKVLTIVSHNSHYELHDALSTSGALALYGGVALYLFAHIAFRLRNVHSVNKQRLALAIFVLVLLPYAMHVPAIVAVATLAILLVVVVSFEATRFSQSRREIRNSESLGHLA